MPSDPDHSLDNLLAPENFFLYSLNKYLSGAYSIRQCTGAELVVVKM